SPELLPSRIENKITQLSENEIGPYELNDFFLYWHVRHGAGPQKILDVAQNAFGEAYDIGTLKKWLINFYVRFSTQQYKRNASADGPKIGMVDLSPRVSWRMSTDAECREWVKQVKSYR
ncbi:MAG: NAD(+) synthase, partial [Candidatus Micrarchaeales archaeon]